MMDRVAQHSFINNTLKVLEMAGLAVVLIYGFNTTRIKIKSLNNLQELAIVYLSVKELQTYTHYGSVDLIVALQRNIIVRYYVGTHVLCVPLSMLHYCYSTK